MGVVGQLYVEVVVVLNVVELLCCVFYNINVRRRHRLVRLLHDLVDQTALPKHQY